MWHAIEGVYKYSFSMKACKNNTVLAHILISLLFKRKIPYYFYFDKCKSYMLTENITNDRSI